MVDFFIMISIVLIVSDVVNNMTANSDSLKFPTEDDYELATDALLLLQDIYKIEPQDLSVGQVKGIKLG